ncbi:hypothetical protein [Shewanella litorisediminis]|nr:hypothetical protein [Shewanella litorisediminis]
MDAPLNARCFYPSDSHPLYALPVTLSVLLLMTDLSGVALT